LTQTLDNPLLVLIMPTPDTVVEKQDWVVAVAGRAPPVPENVCASERKKATMLNNVKKYFFIRNQFGS
jgi:hypothetical protein